MANYENGLKRTNVSIYLKEEARIAYKEMKARHIRVGLLIEEFLIKQNNKTKN